MVKKALTSAPYRITRTDRGVANMPRSFRYMFQLVGPEDRVLTSTWGASPIAPLRIREQQARLNTSHILKEVLP